MGEVIQFPEKAQPIYQVEDCAGCQQRITKDYHEITMPGPVYIALCESCYGDAASVGIFKG